MYVIMRTCIGDTLPFIHSRSTIIQAYLASHWYGSVVASSTPVFCVQFATNHHRLNILRWNVWKSVFQTMWKLMMMVQQRSIWSVNMNVTSRNASERTYICIISSLLSCQWLILHQVQVKASCIEEISYWFFFRNKANNSAQVDSSIMVSDFLSLCKVK